MASFLHQLKVLLWKNRLGVYRQPVWSVVLIIWPVVIFIILAITRSKFPPTQSSDCYLAPRNLQSTGMIPFLQNFLCDTDAKCSNKSFTSNTATSNRLQKRSVYSGGGGSIPQMRSTNDPLAALWDSTAGENLGSILNNIEVVKAAVARLSTGDAKGALCTTITLLSTTQQSTFQDFCNSNQTLASLVLKVLFSQASGSDILTTFTKISTGLNYLQNKEALWNILFMLPEWIINPSLIFEGDLNLFLSQVYPDIADLQSCIKYIVKTATQVQNQSSTYNPLGILEIVLDQSMKNDMKSCISFFQKVSCGSSPCWLNMDNTFEKIYWLMSSLTAGTPSTVCEFNSLTITCNGTINLEMFLESVLTVVNETSRNSSAIIIRYVQQAWALLKQNKVDEKILQQLEQTIATSYPANSQLQAVLTQLVHLLINTTDILIQSNSEQYTGVLQTLLDQINVLIGSELLDMQSLNISSIVTNLTQIIVTEVQYLMNLRGLLSSNVSSQSFVELQTLISSLSTIISEISTLNNTTLLQDLAITNQTAFKELQKTLQTLLNINPIASNITKTIIQELIKTSISSALDVYLKEILQFLNADVALVNNLAFLNSTLNYTQLEFLQSEAFGRYAGNILSFFTPSNLKEISSNPNNVSLELLKLMSGFFPSEEKETFNKVENIFMRLLGLVSTCQTEFSNCTSSIIVFQQQLSDIMQYINDLNSGNMEPVFDSAITLTFVNLSHAEISIVNTMLEMISCSQAPKNISCDTVQDFYRTIIGQVSSVINTALGNESNFVSIVPTLNQIKENVNSVFQVLQSVDVTDLASEIDTITQLSKCYTNATVNPIQCTMELSLSLVDYLQILPFPPSVHNTLFVASSIVKNWLGATKVTTDMYQQLSSLYNLSSMAFHNQSTLMDIYTNLLYIVQQLEELRGNINLTSVVTENLIQDLLETLKLANITYTFPTSLQSQTSQGLQMIKSQLQTIKWYIAFVKNETNTFQSTGNIDTFVTIAQVFITNVLSSIENNNSFVPIADEILNVMNWLQTSYIIPVLQSILDDTLNNGGQSLETLTNHTVSAIEMIIQQVFVNGTRWTLSLNDITDNDITFMVQLLQEYDNGQLTNLTSVLLFTEKVLLTMESLVNDLNLETGFNYNLQTVFNISQEVINLLHNAEQNISVSKNVLYDVYSLLLEGWNGSIFNKFPMLKKRLMDLLYLSMQCLPESTDSFPSQNCSVTDFINITQQILLEFDNQTKVGLSTIEENVTLNNILEYVLNSIHPVNISIAKPEIAITEELACLTTMLNITLKAVSRVNNQLSLNTTWIPEMDKALVKITEKFSTFNITCLTIDQKRINIIYQLFENQSNFWQSIFPLLSDQTSYWSNPSQYGYMDEMFNIIKLYAATRGDISLNNTMINLWNDTLLKILESNPNSSESVLVSEIDNILRNISTYFKTTEGSKEFLAIINRVADLTVASLQLNTSLSHVSIANIFKNDSSTVMYNLIKLMTLENATSIEDCKSTFLNLLTFYQSNITLSLVEPFYSNMSSWTCTMLFSNISASNWQDELKAITDIMVSLQPGAQTNATMKIISSFMQFVTFTNMDTFENFVTSIIQNFIGNDPQTNSTVFQTLYYLINSLQSIVTQFLSSDSASTVEKISIQALETVHVFLRSLNITGYDEMFAFASDILQVYFDFRNSTLPLENLAQKILGQILTSFQESGLQNVTVQLVQSEILSLSSEEQKIVQYILSMVVSAINETISGIALQPPSFNNNLVFNIIKNIVKNFAIEDLGGNKNMTELIFSLVTDILQIAQNWNNVSVAIVFPQNGSNEAVKELEALINYLLSQNSSDTKLYYNYGTNILNIFAEFFAKGEKDQVLQTVQYLLNLSNSTINAQALVNTLENFYDLLNLNKTADWNLVDLYINQLFSFISNSQINKTFLDFSFLFNTSQKLFSSQTNEITYAALELLPFFYPSNLYNISKNSDSLVSTLLNILSKNVPQDQQLAIRNFTDSILSLMELIEKCSNDSTACESAVSGFEALTINVVNVITNMGNGTLNLEISNETLMELETLTDFQILLINNIFSLFWNVQTTTGNLSGDVTNIYQDILSVGQLILNFTKNSNASTVQSDLEMLKNYTRIIDIIQKVSSVNNVTNELLQIINLQKDFQCTNQTLLCIVNLTSHFLSFLQELQVPQPLMEKVLAASSIAEYWLREINTTVDVYQQMVFLFELTRTTLQNEPTLQTILWTLTNISKIIQDMKMDNTSFPIVKDLILNIFNVFEGNLLNSSKSPLHIDSTVLQNLQTQIKIIEWYIIYIKNLTENHNIFGDPYALYRLIQISLMDTMASVQNWVLFSNMSNLSSYEIENLIQLLTTNETGNWTQLENVIHLLEILQQINSIQGLNTVNITTIWQVINKIMTGELNVTQIDGIVKVLQALIITHKITEGSEFVQLYNFILGILNQTYSSGNMNFTQFLQSFLESSLAMDCQSVSRISTAVYKIILNATNQKSPWVDEMFLSNFTLDICTLLHWNNSQDDWLTLLQVSEGLISYVIPLLPDSMHNYFHAAESIILVATEFLTEPDLTQKNIMNILNVVPAINELFNTSAMDWVQNGTFQKFVYFLVDLAWTSSSPKDVLLLKVQNFTITMVQDIQNMLKAQPASAYNAWMTFALEVVKTIINGTQDPSSEERLLKQVWDLFKQNDLEKVIISEVNDLVLNNSFVSSQNAKLLNNLLQLVFNITDSVILDTPLSLSNASTNTTIKVLQMALSSIIQTFLPQFESFTLEFGGLQTGMNITTIFSELQLLLNSVITMQIPTNVTNIEANIFNLLSKYAQIILGSNNTPNMKLLLEAQKIIYEFSQMNTTITLQQLSAIFANYLPMFVGSNNETQAYLYTILNMWQYLNNLTGAVSNDLNNITVEMLPMFQSLLKENTNISGLMSWLVNIISFYIPIEEQDRLYKVANATQHFIDDVQTCRVNRMTCPNLIEEIQTFVSDVIQLETFMQNRSLANSSVLHYGMYNQSQTLINEIFLLLSNAMGHPYNYSSSQGGVYEYVLTLKDLIFNTTMEENLNFTTSLSPQTIIEVLNSVNITNLLHQVENVVQTSTCANQTDKDASLCKLNVTLQLTQLVNQLPLGHTIHSDVSFISSLLGQWIINFNTDISIYQQLIDLHNVTVLTLQYQPILQAVNTSLVSIVYRLQDMGILQNFSMKETDIVSNTLSEIIQQLESGPILYNLSSLLKYNVTELLESIQFTMDIVNWLMLQNQTGIFANPSGTNISTVAQWMINHYQLINIIIRDIESVVNSFNPLSPDATIDALKTLVGDLLTEFLPQTEDKHLTETLQIVLNVTRILLEVATPNMINQIQMFINTVLTFQSDISNDPTKLFLLAMNQTGLLSEIVQFIQSFVVSKDTQFLPQFLDVLQIFNNFAHMNKTITIQDISTVLVKYLQFYSETTNDVQSSLNAIFNLWQYLSNLTNGQSNDSSNTVLQMLPFLESHLLLNENTNLSEIMSWLVNLLSRYLPPEELNRFEKAANASMHVIEAIEACAGNSMTCIDITKAVENFLADMAQLETLVHNRTLANESILQFQSYNRSQIVLMNELFMMLSYAIDHSFNISINQNGVYEDLLTLKNMLLNRTIEEDLNLAIPLYLQNLSEVLASANISQVLLQVEILLSTSTCNNQTDIEPFLCKLNMTLQLTQVLSQLPLPQIIHDNISTISLIVKQWLRHLDNMSTYQQLLELYNLTVLAFDHQFTLQAINTSLINITHILHDIGILQNVSLNETDIAMTILFEMIQLFHFGPNTNNLSIVLQYNISGILEAIQSQLHIMDWLILQVAKTQWNFNSSLTGDTIYSIVQWIQDNNQYISLILREIELVISPFNNFFNLTGIIDIFNMVIQNKPIQSLIYQIGGQIQGFTNISFIWNLLDKNIQTDAEMVWLLLREMESANISLILTFIGQLQQTIQDMKHLDLASAFSNNTISAKVFTIITEGMKIVNNIQAKGTIAKEDIYQIYNFTYLLVQGEQSWVPFQNISAMEDELLDVFYLAMTPFLGGNGSQVYSGNCTAQDVLQILIHTIFNNTTVNKSQEVTTCNWQFIYNSSDATTNTNHTLSDMIYLALQSSPVFHTVCSNGNLQPLAEEMACLIQVIRLSMSVLAELNYISGFQTSLIQTLNDSLTYICSNMQEYNSTFQTEIQIMKNLDAIFLNQSNPVYMLIQFITQHYNSTLQTPVLQQVWTQISTIIKTIVPTNGLVDSPIYELIETAVNLTMQPNWLQSWQNLQNILSMNWTVSNIDSSLSILETIRRAVVFVDGFTDGNALQIYQAIVSLVKNLNFTLLFNATSSQLVNTTMSSVAECTAIINAVTNISSSVWPKFDQSQSELLSSFGVLACNTLYIQSTNYSWASNLDIISNILSNLANYEPAEMNGYFTAIRKIISLLSEIFQSPNISQEILLNRVYELFIQELRLFSNSTVITDWLEKIPVRNLTNILFGSSNNTTFDQVLVLETDLLQLLSRSLNATSYTQGISIFSDSLMTLAKSISSLTGSSGIIQQLTNIMTKLAVIVQIPPLAEPYGSVLNCVKYVADDLTDQQMGHLDVAIQDLFTQSNELANGLMVPEILNEKIYELKNLTTILCTLNGSSNSQSYCDVPCQYLRVLQEVADVATAEIQAVPTAQSFSTSVIITLLLDILDGIYMGIEHKLDQMISSVVPVNELSNITSLLSNFLNITNLTSGDVQVLLGSLFHNRSHVEDQLKQMVKLSQASVTALMNVQMPTNETFITDWFFTLYQCGTNPSLVDEPLQVFCNLSSLQVYQMTMIFLQNVDILQVSYRFLVPTNWQKILEFFKNAMNNLNEKMNAIFKNVPSEEEINFLLNIMKTFLSSPTDSTRQKRSTVSPVCFTTISSTPSLTDISKYLCKGNYYAVSKILCTLYLVEIQSSSNQNSTRAQTLDKLYGIPTDNTFCLNIFTNLVKTTSGATTWTLLKPVLYGKILYTPNTTETQKIMEKTNSKLAEVQNYQKSATALSSKIQNLFDNWKYITLVMELVPQLEAILNNTVVAAFLQEFLQLNATDLSANLTKATSFIPGLITNKKYMQTAQAFCKMLSSLLSCASYNRVQPINSVTEMMAKAEELQTTNELFAAVTFDLPSSTSRKKRSASGLPKNIKYTISMRSVLSEDTNTLRDSSWIPGPHASLNKYSRGFVYLQENIDRAIIELQTNKSLDNVGAQYQPMPYPCYIKNSFLYSMAFSLPIALMITWVLFIASFVKKLVHEKELRLHEYMKMMGINSFSHFVAWFIECASFLLITVAILVLILKFGKILPQSNGFILFLFFLDYSLTIIAMSYLISVFFHNTNVAALSGSLVYIITFFPFIVVVSKETMVSFAGKTLLSLFSPTALSYATQYIVRWEQQNEGIQWHNMYTSPVINDTFSFGWLCWIMLIDSMIYFIVGGYIRTVFPGQYGIGAPWYFPVLPSFWMECCGLRNLFSRKPSGLMISNLVAHGIPNKNGDNLYPQNEPEPTDLNVGVSLHGLTKIYRSKAAVENLNLNFYEGHITSLLGHNGAGKTTTLSMLTGLFSASSGTIYVYGNDIRTNLQQARKDMGVCMQYDVLFDHLTTKEHLLLYGSIKAPQWDKKQLHEEVKRTLKDTGLYRHRHKPVKALSGGMRRKLSICIALIGGSKVVILDEPTTGVDPCSRRSIWEVISKNKKDKTIILSTHHLDEAEVLSDRIAFLEKGGLKCCGTPRFLKEKFGSGYHLTLTKKFPNQKEDEICNSEQVTALIQSHIPEAILKEDVGGELVYVLPPFSAEISGAYLSLLRDLDTSLNDLHIGCYGISDTTIEEVFLKLTDGLDEDEGMSSTAILISNKDTLMVDDESPTNSYSLFDRDDQPLTKMERVTGFKLMLKKVMAMFTKRFHNSKRNWKGLISQILLPVLFVIAAMGLGSLSMGYVEYPELLLSPELYGSTDQAIVFGISDTKSKDLVNAMNSFPGIDNACLDQKMQCLAETSLGSWTYIGNQTLTYGSCNCSTGYMICNAPDAVPSHRMTYSKQMMYNLTGYNMEGYLLTSTLQFIQRRYGGWSFGIPTSQITSILPVSENLTLSKVWYNNEGPHSLPSFLNSFSNFLLRANLLTTESSQYSISVYNKPLPGNIAQGTTTSTLVNTLVALSILVGYSITTASFVIYVVKEYDNGSKRLQHIAGIGEACYWLTNFLYDLAIYFIPVALSIAIIAAFKLPPFYEYPNLGAVSLLFILFGYATFSWMYLISGTFKSPGMAFISYVCINLFIGINTIISSSVVYMLVQQKSTTDKDYQSLSDTYNVLINFFKIFPQFCFGYGLILLSQQQTIADQLKIYGNYDKPDVFGMDILGYMYVAMVVQGTFCFILRLLINDGIIYSLKAFVKKTCLKKYNRIPVKNPEEDEDVSAERERVDIGNANGDLLLVQGLTKIFHQVKRNMIAVNNMTLGIPPGECFGLLGVNGAGKTTTFKMLTGEVSPSSGNIQVRNHFGNLVKVLGFNTDWSSFGYCPQEDALDELMTGEEHLYYYARIHGIPEKEIKHVARQLLQKLQLVQYKDRITASYSCGTRRKLSTALALVGKPSILLLDEPSSGMDPKTKRHLWKIISEEVRDKCAVILTSHSMEECEALCTRLAIMVKGKFQCIGSLQHIKSRFGSGFTVKMHLKDSSISIETITSFMHSHFPNTFLKEQHFTMAEYHVPVSAGGVASIFDLLESRKRQLNIIHFSVSQTTLDEVFINFAQSHSSPDNSRESDRETPQLVAI